MYWSGVFGREPVSDVIAVDEMYKLSRLVSTPTLVREHWINS